MRRRPIRAAAFVLLLTVATPYLSVAAGPLSPRTDSTSSLSLREVWVSLRHLVVLLAESGQEMDPNG
jgi:hypothetical protein